MTNMKVTKVTKTAFETEDGQTHDLPLELDEAPSVEDFQKTLDMWRVFFQGEDGREVDSDADWSPGAYIESSLASEEDVRREVDDMLRSDAALHAKFADKMSAFYS